MKLAVIGAGHWHAPRHIESFLAAGATIAGVTADEPGVASRWAARLGCTAYEGHEELLDHAQVDLVLAMPRHRDAPAVLAELTRRRLPFVIEKPPAVDAPTLLPYVLAVEEQRQFAAVPFINRYGEFWNRLRGLRARNLLAPATVARFRIVNGPPGRYVADGVSWVLDPAISGGGAMRNLGTHTVDAFLSLAEGEVEVAGSAVTHRQHRLAVEEHAVAVLRDQTGLIGVVEAGYSRPDDDGTDQEWCVAGPGVYLTETHDSVEIVEAGHSERHASPTVMQRYRLFAEDVLHALTRGAPPPIPLRDSWRVLDVIDRVYAAAAPASR
jgi:predicted dehydrogenase